MTPARICTHRDNQCHCSTTRSRKRLPRTFARRHCPGETHQAESATTSAQRNTNFAVASPPGQSAPMERLSKTRTATHTTGHTINWLVMGGKSGSALAVLCASLKQLPNSSSARYNLCTQRIDHGPTHTAPDGAESCPHRSDKRAGHRHSGAIGSCNTAFLSTSITSALQSVRSRRVSRCRGPP